jgi:hypothetical protein
VNDATRAAHQAQHPATLRLPAAFEYPLGGIVGRTAIGLVLLGLALLLLLQAGVPWTIGGAVLGLLGAVVVASNLTALADRERRKIVLDGDGVEVRYGFSRRHYRFLDYSAYRISRLGLRSFLTALPIEIDRSLGERSERVRVTLYDRPAFLAPMPVLGGGAPSTLLEWQSTLNDLRRNAIASAGLGEALERETRAEHTDEAHRAAVWRAQEQAGRPSRLSRSAYSRRQIILGVVFLALLVGPVGLSYAVKHGIIAICGQASEAACLAVNPAFQQLVMIGGPLLALVVFVGGSARLMVRRAHDLDEDLPYWKAALESFTRGSALQHRLSRDEGTAGTNRFGPIPRD